MRLTRQSASNIFLSGPLRLKAGVTLVIDAHTALFGSRDPRDYDIAPGSCGVLSEMGKRGPGCKPLLLAEDAPGSGVMGRGAIDGRGGAVMRGQDLTWWELAKKAKVYDLQQTCPRILVVRRSNGFTLAGLTLRNSANFHVVAERTDGFTAWGVKIQTPKTARNSDGIDPSSSTNVTIAHCLIDTGDDNVAIKAGGAGPTTHVTIAHNRFWNGHGMSIGSNTNGGVRAVRVTRPHDRRRRQRPAHQVRPQPRRPGGGRGLRGRLHAQRAEPDRAHLDVHDVPRHACCRSTGTSA